MPGDTRIHDARINHLDLTGRVSITGAYCIQTGGSSDVWEGTYDDGGSARKVAVKIIREFGQNTEKTKQRLKRELNVWTRLHHKHVLPLVGFVYDVTAARLRLPCLVAPWITSGTARSFLVGKPLAEKYKILSQIAIGLAYLHQNNVIHGDIKGDNVLISDEHNALIPDFGLSAIIQDIDYQTNSLRSSARWTAPELYQTANDDDFVVKTTKSDVWAFGMTILELITSNVPYAEHRHEPTLLFAIYNCETPRRPARESGLCDEVWSICMKCWREDPADRPSIEDVLEDIRVAPTDDLEPNVPGNIFLDKVVSTRSMVLPAAPVMLGAHA